MAKTTWKQIERSRETRLWLKEIILPVTLIVAGIASQVDLKQKFCDFKNWGRGKFDIIRAKFKK